MSLELIDLVKRPGLGKAGKPIRVRVNFFEVTAFPANNIYHSDVEFEPASTPVAIYRKVWHALEKTGARGVFNGIKTIFDGRKNAFSPKVLPLGEEQAASFEVRYFLLFFFITLHLVDHVLCMILSHSNIIY